MLFAACRGNGGSSYSDGAVYNPGGGASGSSGSIGGSVVTAEDLWDLSNAGKVDRIVELFQTGFTNGTCIVVIPAADLGLPAGGSVTLTITGPGINYTADAAAGADGNVTFEVPLLETKTTVTVSLTVQDVNGTALYIGSEEQEVGDDGNLHVGLVRLFWTLPSTLTVTASPDGLVYYSSSWTTDSTTFSISGLESAPAGAVFTYEWEDADDPGTLAGTGATLTKTVSELLGGMTPTSSDDVTKTFSVTVTYTDTSGTTATASGSASVVIGGPVILPASSVAFTAPASINTAKSPAGTWALTSMSDTFSFTAVPDSGEPAFPSGTTFEWHVNGSLVSQTGATCTLRPADLYTATTIGTQASPSTISVTCTAKNSRATADKNVLGGSRSLFYIFDLPDFSVSVSMASSAYVAAKSSNLSGTVPTYALKALGSSFNLSATGATFPTGTTFEWKVGTNTLSGTDVTSSFSPGTDLSMTESSIGRALAAAASFTITCTAKNPHADDKDGTGKTVKAFLLYVMPTFRISISPPLSYSAENSNAGSNTYALTNLSDGFTLTATLTDPTASFPPETTFSWSYGSDSIAENAGPTVTLTPVFMGVTTSTTSPTGKLLGCRATSPNAIADERGGNPYVYAFYVPSIPAYTVGLTATTAETADCGGNPGYKYSSSASFTFNAGNGVSFPTGTTFDWEIVIPGGSFGDTTWPDYQFYAETDGGSSLTITLTTAYVGELDDISYSVAVREIRCTAKLPGATDVKATYTLYLN